MATSFNDTTSPYSPSSSGYRDADDEGVRIVSATRASHRDGAREESSVPLDEYDLLTPAAGSNPHPTDIAYERNRRRYINPTAPPQVKLGQAGLNLVEDAVGDTYFGYLSKGVGKVAETAKRIWDFSGQDPVPPPLPPPSVMRGKMRARNYEVAEGKWNRNKGKALEKRMEARKPVTRGGLVEDSGSDASESDNGDDEEEYNDARDRDYVDLDTNFRPGFVKMRSLSRHAEEKNERSSLALARDLARSLTLSEAGPMDASLTASERRAPRPYKLHQTDSTGQSKLSRTVDSLIKQFPGVVDDQFIEGVDSDFDNDEGGVPWPLDGEMREKHVKKITKRRDEEWRLVKEEMKREMERRTSSPARVAGLAQPKTKLKSKPRAPKPVERPHTVALPAEGQSAKPKWMSKKKKPDSVDVMHTERNSDKLDRRAQRAAKIFQEGKEARAMERQKRKQKAEQAIMDDEDKLNVQLEVRPDSGEMGPNGIGLKKYRRGTSPARMQSRPNISEQEKREVKQAAQKEEIPQVLGAHHEEWKDDPMLFGAGAPEDKQPEHKQPEDKSDSPDAALRLNSTIFSAIEAGASPSKRKERGTSASYLREKQKERLRMTKVKDEDEDRKEQPNNSATLGEDGITTEGLNVLSENTK